jgi:hypothetical protein
MALDARTDRLPLDRTIRVRTLLLVAGIAAAGLGLFALINALGGDDGQSGGRVTGSSGDEFTLSYPQSWRPVSGEDLERIPGKPLAVVRRREGKGFVILRREKRAPRNFGAFSADLTKALDRRVPDFQKRSSKVIEISAGKAFFYSYIRRSKGTVHTVVLVPAGERSYVLNTVSQGDAPDVARQVARIILAFKA